MEFSTVYLVDIIADVVEKTRQQLATDRLFNNIQVPYYFFDTVSKFKETILSMDKTDSKFNKYPLVFLELPFQENYTVDRPVIYEASINLYILNRTSLEINATRRYDDVFKPVLYPIFEQFINQLRLSNSFAFDDMRKTLSFNKTDVMYWGEGSKNLGNDIVDCIEISNLKLKVIKNCT